MMVRWWWVRHAPIRSDWPAGAMIGWTDAAADLADEEALARRRASLPERARLATSDLARARDTGAALRRPGWIATPPSPAFREQHFGRWEGRTHAAVAEAEPEAASTFWRAPGEAAPPGGESFADVCRRVGREIAEENLRDAADDLRDVVCVAHAGAIRAALAVALDLAPGRALAFEVAPLSLTRMDWIADRAGGGWAIRCVNAA